MIPTKLPSHYEESLAQLATQYREKPRFEALLKVLTIDIDEFEQIFFDLMDNRSLYNADGKGLDAWGEILNQPRGALADDELYRIVLFAKVAQNISKGTPEDVIIIYKLLMRAGYVDLAEQYPARFSLLAVNANPIGKIEDVKAAVRRAKPAGVQVDLFTSSPGEAFGFAEDPDPNVRGFGTLSNPDVGGFFTSIL